MVINYVYDVKSGEKNTCLTQGRPIKIFGSRLNIGGNDPRVGVWFVSAADETVRISMEDGYLVDNSPSRLTVVVPPLQEGDWYVEAVTQSTTGKTILRKDIRTARFELPLSVQ